MGLPGEDLPEGLTIRDLGAAPQKVYHAHMSRRILFTLLLIALAWYGRDGARDPERSHHKIKTR